MPSCPESVRLALPDDEDDIMDLLRVRHVEQGSQSRWEDDLARSQVKLGIGRVNGFIGVIRGQTGVEGTVGLFPAREWYSFEPFLHDLWFYVHSHHRQSDHAKNLFKFATWVAEANSVQLRMTEVGDAKNGLIRFLSRNSEPVGMLFRVDSRSKDRLVA